MPDPLPDRLDVLAIAPHPDDLARVTEHVAGLWSARRPHTSFRNRNLTRDGRVVWCEWYNSVLFDPAGAPASALSLVLDVTDRVAAEGAAVRAEARLRQTLGGARMVGWEWNYATQRVTATAPLGEYFGAPPGRDYGTWEGAWSVIHPDDLAKRRANFEEALAQPVVVVARDRAGVGVEREGAERPAQPGQLHVELLGVGRAGVAMVAQRPQAGVDGVGQPEARHLVSRVLRHAFAVGAAVLRLWRGFCPKSAGQRGRD